MQNELQEFHALDRGSAGPPVTPHVEQVQPSAPPRDSGWFVLAQVVRLLAGIVLLALLALLVNDTMDVIERITRPRFGEPASAVQVTQVYAERIFYAVSIIGAGVLVYIATRAAR